MVEQERQFIGAVTDVLPYFSDDLIQTSILRSFRDDLNPEWKKYVKNLHKQALVLSKLENIQPVWLDTSNLLVEATKLYAPVVWESMLSWLDIHMHTKMTLLYRTSNLVTSEQVAWNFSVRNHRLIGAAIQDMVLAASYGRQATAVSTESLYRSAQSAQETFGHPASNFEDLLGRLQYLFPSPGSRRERTALKLFGIHGTFNNKRTCPAVPMTRVILDTYGEVLTDPSYQLHLREVSTK